MAKLTTGVALESMFMTAVVLDVAAFAAEVTVGRATSRRLATYCLPALLVVMYVSWASLFWSSRSVVVILVVAVVVVEAVELGRKLQTAHN